MVSAIIKPINDSWCQPKVISFYVDKYVGYVLLNVSHNTVLLQSWKRTDLTK